MNENFINQKEIRVLGLKRTGHHAVINWIIKQTKGTVCFINDVKVDRNPFRTSNAYSSIKDRKKQMKGDLRKKDLLIYSYEDKLWEECITQFYEDNRESYVGKSKEKIDILIVRDPFNHFASRLKTNRKKCLWSWGEENEENAKYYMEKWKNHTKKYLHFKESENVVIIDYNKWARNKPYREELANRLGIEFTDDGFEEITKAGGGSAFTGRKLDGKASQMDILNRWKVFYGDPYYLSLFDKEIMELSKKIWTEEELRYMYVKIGLFSKFRTESETVETKSSKNKVKSILIDLKNITLFLDKPNHIPNILLNLAHYLQTQKGTKIYIHMLARSHSALNNFLKTKQFKFEEIDLELDGNAPSSVKRLQDVDFYIGFCGFKHRGKRKCFKQSKKPYLVYEAGGMDNTLLVDPIDIYGGGHIAKQFDSILKNYPLKDTQEYCNYMVKNHISKRTQKGNSQIPDEKFIFLPGQALRDTSITKCSTIGILEFIDIVSAFAKKHNLLIVFKPHPGLVPGKPRHGREAQLDHCKKYDNIRIIENSIYNIIDKALFTATINCGVIVDCFMANTPIYCSGESYFMRTKALHYNNDINKGLLQMLNKEYDWELMKERQLQTISWLRDNLLIETASPAENCKRVERIANIVF
ncbi:MAG: hypothetical protein ACTSSP_01765 [Candidatus Asgardarchaeia archaeon]